MLQKANSSHVVQKMKQQKKEIHLTHLLIEIDFAIQTDES